MDIIYCYCLDLLVQSAGPAAPGSAGPAASAARPSALRHAVRTHVVEFHTEPAPVPPSLPPLDIECSNQNHESEQHMDHS